MLCPGGFEESGVRRWQKQSSVMSLGSTGDTCRLIIDSYYLLLWNLDFSVTPALGTAQIQGSSQYTQITM